MITNKKIYTKEFVKKEIESFIDEINKPGNNIVFWQDLIRYKPYSRQRLSEWKKEFTDDPEISDSIQKIEEELENRVIKLGLFKKGAVQMAKFVLINNYGWREKVETENVNNNNYTHSIIEIKDGYNKFLETE